jgi:DTW domain-containing protein
MQRIHPGQRPMLVVPDGNWRQASKMRARIDGLAALPCVVLSPGEQTRYHLRSEPKVDGLATFEAVVRAVQQLEGERGEEIATAMMAVFTAMVDRTRWLRGQLRTEEVSGGIPPEAIEFYRTRANR